MRTALIATLIFGIIAAVVWVVSSDYLTASTQPTPVPVPTATSQPKAELIKLTKPEANESVTGPLTVRGEARGNWFFEASFPVRLVDATGVEVGKAIAQAQGEWMTEQFVPFTATVTFSGKPTTDTGSLILEKNNPSGIPENADQLVVPVKFK